MGGQRLGGLGRATEQASPVSGAATRRRPPADRNGRGREAGSRTGADGAGTGTAADDGSAGRHAIGGAPGVEQAAAGAADLLAREDATVGAPDPAAGQGLFDEGPAPQRAAADTVVAEPAHPLSPSPVPRSDGASADSGGPAATTAHGFMCDHGHLNDPRAPYCGQCGAAMDERASALVVGERPPLGRIVFDDGATYPVEHDFLVGRMPETDDRVRSGGAQPIIVEDRTGSVSRVHAEIQIAGWDVMLLDAGSRNGTFVAGPEDAAWSPLPPQRGRRLLPGTRVRLGARTFVFESASGLR